MIDGVYLINIFQKLARDDDIHFSITGILHHLHAARIVWMRLDGQHHHHQGGHNVNPAPLVPTPASDNLAHETIYGDADAGRYGLGLAQSFCWPWPSFFYPVGPDATARALLGGHQRQHGAMLGAGGGVAVGSCVAGIQR